MAWILRIIAGVCVAAALVCIIVIALLSDVVTQLKRRLDTH